MSRSRLDNLWHKTVCFTNSFIICWVIWGSSAQQLDTQNCSLGHPKLRWWLCGTNREWSTCGLSSMYRLLLPWTEMNSYDRSYCLGEGGGSNISFTAKSSFSMTINFSILKFCYKWPPVSENWNSIQLPRKISPLHFFFPFLGWSLTFKTKWQRPWSAQSTGTIADFFPLNVAQASFLKTTFIPASCLC